MAAVVSVAACYRRSCPQPGPNRRGRDDTSLELLHAGNTTRAGPMTLHKVRRHLDHPARRRNPYHPTEPYGKAVRLYTNLPRVLYLLWFERVAERSIAT